MTDSTERSDHQRKVEIQLERIADATYATNCWSQILLALVAFAEIKYFFFS